VSRKLWNVQVWKEWFTNLTFLHLRIFLEDLCTGGWDDAVYSYSISTGGCTSSTYAYYGYKRQECSASKSRKRIVNTKVKGWYLLPNDEETIRNYLYNVGPAFVSFYLYENFYSLKSGIYSSVEGKYGGAHAVLLTGYGTENGTDYWIMRNSWGELMLSIQKFLEGGGFNFFVWTRST